MQKRIGIIMGKVYKEVNRQQLCGMLEEAYARGYSAYVFTLTDESWDSSIIKGEENLFSAIHFSELDGIIYLPYTFSSDEYTGFIQRFLQENCPLPVVRVTPSHSGARMQAYDLPDRTGVPEGLA